MGSSQCLFSIFMQLFVPLIFFNFTTATFSTASSVLRLCHDDECSALLQFKESLIINDTIEESYHYYPWSSGCRPKAASWKPEEGNIDCCSWDGVECSENTGHVMKLDLSNSCLYGSINSSSSLFKLVHLEWLNLAFNDFKSSEIPSEIINLSRLSYLNLSHSSFFGQIPSEILELVNLVSLDLSLNSGYGLELQKPNFANLVEKLSNLETLDLGYVSIRSTIPHNLANLSSLTFLSLHSCGLQGELPVSIGNLHSLKKLDLSINNLSGELPTSIQNLVSLEELDLSFNKLSGEFPWSIVIGNFTQLQSLDFTSNKFSGELHASIGNLRSLEVLAIGRCNFSGRIPSSLRNLTQLITLDLSQNSYRGTMELDFLLVSLKNLEVLSLSSNWLSLLTKVTSNTTSQKFTVVGLRSCNLIEFPNFLKNQHHLMLLDLSSNRIHGKIPSWLLDPSTQNLSALNLSHNLLTGFDQQLVVLPGGKRFLLTLDLSSNNLQGPLPVPPSRTVNYLVSNNSFIGEIPSWLCKLDSLEILVLSHNNLSGLLPRCLGSFSDKLSILDLRANNFFGTIPNTFMKESRLGMIDLSHNLFQGRIPRSLINCSKLEFLDIGDNQIRDIFPSWLGTLPNLTVLILQSNKFYGIIREPRIDCGFSKLRIIDLSNNRFTGKLPSKSFLCWNAMKIVNTSDLKYLQDVISPKEWLLSDEVATYDYSLKMNNKGQIMTYDKVPDILTSIILSSNRFDGMIPTSIANLKGLQVLNLDNNNLQGHIPSCLGNLTNLESLDLSNNNFLGQIPQQLVELTFLEFFNVSDNYLTGPIPQGRQFATFDNSSFESNSGLCGRPLSRECESDEAPTNEDHSKGAEESIFRRI
ncbi:Receptor-like protein 6 [Citrus sinensis]|nr:Receptor-like protein 6 [Citrus sinensis]